VSDELPGGAPTFEQPDFSNLAGTEDPADDDAELDYEDEDDDGGDDGEDEVTEDEVTEDDAGGPESPNGAADVPVREAEGNAAVGGMAAAVLTHVATSIVDEKDSVVVETKEGRGQLRLYLHVAPSDMGRIIGRRGRTAQAVRTLVRAAAAAEGHDAFVEIVD
jgi:predicted RNA-binding protein YlqC (UPF0109 family)